MIFPQQTDRGRRVVYRPPEAGHRYGSSRRYTPAACLSGSIISTTAAVNAAYLEFTKRPAEAVPSLGDCRKAGCNRSSGLQSEHLKTDPSPG